jgi:hypothetical protein
MSLRWFFCAGAVVLAAACSQASEEATADDDLVGGDQAKDGDFPSTMIVRDNCTVSKVGPRHILTAAHCVFDEGAGQIRAEYQPGATIYVSSRTDVDNRAPLESAGYRAVTLVKVHVPGVLYQEKVTNGWPRPLLESAAPDVAIMEITEGTAPAIADVPEAAIDLRPLAPGDNVVIMGYGCEKGVAAEKDYSRVRLKTKATKLVGVDATVHPGSYVTDPSSPFAKNLEKQYLFTPGQGIAAEQASLCPGDSGGPVYRDDGGANVIVGVNAYYSFADQATDPARISKTNWHTRLDAESRFDVGSWLKSLGVKTTGGAATTHYDGCTTSAKTGRSACGEIGKYAAQHGGEATFGAPTTEARFERDAAGAWRWTQVFADKTVSIVDGAVHVEDAGAAKRCATVTVDGAYCGTALGDPDARVLYKCKGGAVAERTVCATTCKAMPPGTPDACAPEGWVDPCKNATLGDGRYCAAGLGDSETNALYNCQGKVTFAKTVCPKGCKQERAGVPDHCN